MKAILFFAALFFPVLAHSQFNTTATTNSTTTNARFIWLGSGGTGNLGVGTAVNVIPAERMHVVGTTRSDKFNATTGIFSTIGTTNMSFSTNSSSTNGTGGTTWLTILNSNGNVGIGNTAPADKLHVTGNTRTTGNFIANGNFITEAGVMNVPNSVAPITFQLNSTPRMTILNSGNVGIGTTSPAHKLEVVGPTSGSGAAISASGGGDVLLNTGGSVFFDGNYSYGAGNYIRPVAANTQAFFTAGTERLRITSTGNIGIGTTTPAYKLAVNGQIGAKDLQLISTGWPDYVFSPTYKLPGLYSVEQYIKTHQHLEGIPSAAEVEKDGYSVNQLNEALLKKVEELTLYLIQQQKEIDALKQKLEQK